MSPFADRRLAKARRVLEAGRLSECERLAKDLISKRAHPLRAHVLLARVKLGRWAASRAVRQLSVAVQRDPTSIRTLLMLSVAASRQEDRDAALDWAQKAADLDSGNIETLLWCGQRGLEARQPEAAEVRFRRAIELDPTRPAGHHGLGLAVAQQGKAAAACASLREAMRLAPGAPQIRIDLIEVLLALADGSEGVEEARGLLQEMPDEPIAHLLLAQSLTSDGKPAQAEPEAVRAIQLAPDEGATHATLGSIQMALGRLEESRESSRRSLELDSRQGLAYFNLIRSSRASEDDRPMLRQMAELLEDRSLPPAQHGLLAYGLGKGHEDMSEFEQAMGYYDRANRIEYGRKFGSEPCDMEANRAAYMAAKRRFADTAVASEREASGVTPIFVFGMIRSGTTLLEQILSSHPEVGGAGEVPFWPRRRSAAYAADGLSLDPGALAALADEYLALLAKIAPGKPFVVDKMPTNFMHAGLLSAAFPSAPLLHVRRDPLDTCLSIYATHNRVPIPWSHDKANIALNYERYMDLMDFWAANLPRNRITEVRYEALVSDPRTAIADVLRACGLDWSEACLSPEKNTRSVSTPSVCQVRRPIYQTSVERWRRFEPWLGELARLREGAIER